MTVEPVKTLLDMTPGTEIDSARGVIKTLGAFKQGQSENWSFQNIFVHELGDPGIVLKVKIRNHPELKQECVGSTVYFQKGKPKSLMLEAEQLGTSAHRILFVEESATFEFTAAEKKEKKVEAGAGKKAKGKAKSKKPGKKAKPVEDPDAGEAEASKSAPNDPAILKAEADRKAAEAQAKKDAAIRGIKNVRSYLGKVANLELLCLGAARFIREKYKAMYGDEMTNDQFQGINSSLFIACDRNGYTNQLPSGEITEYIETIKQESKKDTNEAEKNPGNGH